MANFGETLKRERELREISLRQVSEATKIALRYLEALEENRFDALPGGLFNKGFIRAYSAYIGLDGEAMVNSYLQEMGGRQPGIESSAATRSTPTMHRPHEAIARRAGAAPQQRPATPAPRATAVPRAATPRAPDEPARKTEQDPAAAATPHAAPRKAKMIKSVSSLEAIETGRPAGPVSETHATLAALEKILDQKPRRPAVSGIENADSEGPPSSRVLVWVLSFVAAAGVLFLVVSLVRGTKPDAGRSIERPEASGSPAPASPSGSPEPAHPEAAKGPVTQETQGLVPEITAQSPLMLGAPGTPPGKDVSAAAPPAATPAPPPKPKRLKETPPSPPPLAAPVEDRPAEAAPVADAAADAAKGPMRVVVEARGRTHVVLNCDGQEVVNRIMEGGETEKAKCDTIMRVSAANAGAVSLSVNGGVCLPLGDPGTRAYGYTIRIDDYTRICPPLGGARHGRR